MVITSRKNDTVRYFRELLRSKKMRDSNNTFAAEGDHLCGELAAGGFAIKYALVTEKALQKYPQTCDALHRTENFAVISDDVAEYISDTGTPQGIFAAAEKPQLNPDYSSASRLVLLDGVQDPGNAGTIIRTAEALGFDGAVLSPECADIWSPKTLRASMGSVFRLPCVSESMTACIPRLKEQGIHVYGAMLDKSAEQLGEIKFPQRSAIIIGSEGRGVSEQAAQLCTGAVYIPISGAESLNAAAAASIILWELSKK